MTSRPLHRRFAALPTVAGSSFLVLLGAAGARAEEPWSLDVFVERVLAESPDAAVVDREAGVVAAERVGVGLWPNPFLEWERQSTAGANPLQDVVVVSVPLVLSGRLGLEREAAGLSGEAAEARRVRARAELRHRATAAFAGAVALAERRRVLDASLASLGRLGEVIAAREQAGEASGYERLRIDLERAVVADESRALDADQRRQAAELRRLLAPTRAEPPPLDLRMLELHGRGTAEPLLADLAQRRGDLRALDLDERAATMGGRAAAARGIPDPRLTAGGILVSDLGSVNGGAGYVVGFTVPLPLFEHGQGPKAVAGARAEAARARRALLLHEATVRLRAALIELTGREERAAQHRSTVLAPAEELRRITEAAYQGGESGLLVLVDAERNLREARLSGAGLADAILDLENDLLLLAGAYDAVPERSAAR